jgi:hypothetical protein
LTTRDCAGGVSASGVGSSALIVHNRTLGGPPPDRRRRAPELDRKYLKKNDNFPVKDDIRPGVDCK